MKRESGRRAMSSGPRRVARASRGTRDKTRSLDKYRHLCLFLERFLLRGDLVAVAVIYSRNSHFHPRSTKHEARELVPRDSVNGPVKLSDLTSLYPQ